MSATTVMEKGTFSGHETFPLRYTWLRKAVQHVSDDAQIFQHDDAMVQLGVGKNMVRAMRHWATVCGVVHEDPEVPNNRGRFLCPTPLGKALLADGGWDPYLEDPGSLWALHYELASSPEGPTTWYWTFNHLPQPEFTKAELVGWLTRLAQEKSWNRVSPASLKRDIDVFLRTYVPSHASRTTPLEDTLDCPFIDLELIRHFDAKDSYLLQRGDQPSLPNAVFAFGLVRFLGRRGLSSSAVPVQAIGFAPGSPGRVFALTEGALVARLEHIEEATDGAIVFHDTAGLRQLLIHRMPDANTILGRHFGKRGARGRAA